MSAFRSSQKSIYCYEKKMNRGEGRIEQLRGLHAHNPAPDDKTREPVGTEIFVGCFAHAPVPLNRTVVLDAGCGTGNYSDALLHKAGGSRRWT